MKISVISTDKLNGRRAFLFPAIEVDVAREVFNHLCVLATVKDVQLWYIPDEGDPVLIIDKAERDSLINSRNIQLAEMQRGMN